MTLHHSLRVAHQLVNLSKQGQRNVNRLLLLELKSCSDTVSADWYCQVLQNLVTRSRTDVRVNLAVASSCCTPVPTPMWPTEFKTKWMLCDRRCWDIVHTTWTHCCVVNISRPFKEAVTSCTFMSNDSVQGLWYSAVVSSPRKCLPVGYADRCSTGVLSECPCWFFPTVCNTFSIFSTCQWYCRREAWGYKLTSESGHHILHMLSLHSFSWPIMVIIVMYFNHFKVSVCVLTQYFPSTVGIWVWYTGLVNRSTQDSYSTHFINGTSLSCFVALSTHTHTHTHTHARTHTLPDVVLP